MIWRFVKAQIVWKIVDEPLWGLRRQTLVIRQLQCRRVQQYWIWNQEKLFRGLKLCSTIVIDNTAALKLLINYSNERKEIS